MTGENGGRANLDSDAQNRTFPAAGQHAGSGLEIRNRRAASHPHQVLEANRRLEPQVFRDIRGETRAEVAGASVDDQTGYLGSFHAGLRQRTARGGGGGGSAELEKARQPPVGIGFEGIRLGLHPQIPALDLAVQENAAIQILLGWFQVEVRVEEFVGLLLRYIEWGGGGAQTSENGLQEFAPSLNRMIAAIRNQRAGSTESVTLSSCRNKALSSPILKPRRMESRTSCRTPAAAPTSSSLAARDASRERLRSLISTLLSTKPRSLCSSVTICALLK